MKVLITDGEYLHALGIIRYLGIKNIEVHVISFTSPNIGFCSKFCKKRIISPVSPYLEKDYISFVERILNKERYDVLIPVGFQTTKIFAKYRSQIQNLVGLELASYDSIIKAMDKSQTNELAEKLGILYPKTIYPEKFNEIEDLSHQLDYPVVIKGRYEAGKQVISHPRNSKEFILNYYELCKENNFKEGSLPMVQENIGEGGNECLAALYQKGKPKRLLVYKARRCFPIKGGSSSSAITFYDEEIIEKGKKLLDALKWHGMADVEFKRDRTSNELKLMEINPKLYATVEVAMRAGMNFPYYLCQMAKGQELEFSDDYVRNLVYQYPFSKEIFHLKEKPVSFLHVLFDFFNPNIKSNIWIRDIKSNLFELFSSLASLLPKKIKNIFRDLIKT